MADFQVRSGTAGLSDLPLRRRKADVGHGLLGVVSERSTSVADRPKPVLRLTRLRNADSWVFRMTSYNGGEFADLEIFFEPSAAPSLGKEATLCELVVEALVGEELRLERIGEITPVSVPDVRAIENTTAMKHLRPHLIEALSSTRRDPIFSIADIR